ncbi:MAG: hypothetical protein Q8P67_07790, partial [archaeon]|nr:hypothetical protein [archaeon]
MSSLTSPWSDVPDCLSRAEHKCDEALVAFMNGVIHACFFLGENGDALLEEFLNERYTRQGLKPNWFYVEPGRYSPGVLMAMKRRKAYDGWERLFFCKHHTTLIGGPFFKKSMARPKPKQMQLLEPQGEADRDIVQHSPAQFHQALNFIWYKANRGRFYLPIYSRGSTLVNHIPNEVELTHKDNLAKNLAEYTRSLLQLDHMPF